MQKHFDLCKFLGRDKKHLFQKLLPIEKVDTTKLKFPMWVSEKFDGVFCCAILDAEGKVHICSRTGEEYLSMEHLKPFFKANLIDDNYIIFEAVIRGEGQNVVSGACRDTKNQHPEILAIVHTEVQDGMAYIITRKAKMIAGKIMLLEHFLVNSLADAMKLAELVWSWGGEGIVLHCDDIQPYQPGKRNSSIIKIKKGLSVDLRCIGVFKGEGKYKDTLGGILCSYKGKTIRISGMTDAERAAWWKDNNLIVGKIVQVDAMGESALGKLREPRFKGIRFDKEEADY